MAVAAGLRAVGFLPKLLRIGLKPIAQHSGKASAAKMAHKLAGTARGAGKAAGTVAEYAIPGYQRGAGRNQLAGLLAADVVPETLYATMHASMMPEGTPMATRVGAGLEDAAIGMGLSWLGQGAAEGGLRAIERRTGKRINDHVRYATKAGIGGATMMGGYSLLPKPFTESAYQKAEEAMLAEEQFRRQQEDAQLAAQVEQNTINQLFGGVF